jgi:transposase, IS6 family
MWRAGVRKILPVFITLGRGFLRPTLGFQSMKTAYATIKGFEVMRMFKKGQFAPWIDAIGGGTEAHFINRLFGLYA